MKKGISPGSQHAEENGGGSGAAEGPDKNRGQNVAAEHGGDG